MPVNIDLLDKAVLTIANDFLLGADNSLGSGLASILNAVVLD